MRQFLKCPYCGRIDPLAKGIPYPPSITCVTCSRYYSTQQNIHSRAILFPEEQMKLDDILSKSFKKPGGKTLKLEIAKDVPLTNAVSDALEYLNHESNIEHNRIEFKYGRNYIVVAKLKDES